MKLFSALLLLISIFLLAGCKGRDAQLAGAWAGPNSQTITLKADKTFTAGGPMPGMDGSGSWALAADKLSLKIDAIGGKPIGKFIDEQLTKNAAMIKMSGKSPADLKKQIMDGVSKPQEMTVSADNKTLTSVTAGKDGKPAVFTKKD